MNFWSSRELCSTKKLKRKTQRSKEEAFSLVTKQLLLLILASRCCTAANCWGVPRPPKWNDIEDLMNNNYVINEDAKEDEGRRWKQIYRKILCQPGKLLKDFKKIIQQVITSIRKQMKGQVSQPVRQWQKENSFMFQTSIERFLRQLMTFNQNQHWKIVAIFITFAKRYSYQGMHIPKKWLGEQPFDWTIG